MMARPRHRAPRLVALLLAAVIALHPLPASAAPLLRNKRGGDGEQQQTSAAAAAGGAPPPLVISKEQCEWAIVRPTNPNCFEVRASEVLRDEIQAATGSSCVPTLQRESQPRTQPHNIYVGATERLRATKRLSHLQPEEAAFMVDGADLLLAGDDTGAPLHGNTTAACSSHWGSLPACVGAMPTYASCRAGTLYAAYGFARRILGVLAVWPGEDGLVRRAGQTVRLNASMEWRTTPGIPLRQIRPNPTEQMYSGGAGVAVMQADIPGLFDAEAIEKVRFAEHDWYMRMGLGTRGTPPWGQAFEGWWDAYGSTHPEYFALQADGHRGPDTAAWGAGKQQWTKMCVSQPALWTRIMRNWENQTLLSGVGNHSLGVSACEDDYDGGYCGCSKCRALDRGVNTSSGRLSDRYAAFWNAVYAEMAAHGHAEQWVSGYAYASYRDPPVATKLEGNILILSVGFSSYPMLRNETTAQRQAWSGWRAAGAKALALRPNSLWDGYSSAPYNIARQLGDDLVFTAQHGLYATDFDSNVAHYQAVGPSYYVLARALWDPKNANVTALLAEYYSAYGGAAPAMRAYHEYWGDWTTATFTSPRVRARLAELALNPATGNGRSYWITIPEIYTDQVPPK